MAVANGYGKTVTSGSVFMYDTGDTINSYRGEPTTNLINPNVVNIYSWWTRNVASIVQLSETYKGQPIYRVSISIDNGDMLYHITERWGAGSGWYMPYVTFNANTPYIASVIYRPVSHTDTRIYGHPSNISGWGATVDGSIDIDAQWKMHRIDRNFGSTVSDNRFYHMHTPSAQIGQTIVVDITNSQIEQNSHVTPFVNGTRSTTQGLLPIVGNSTINLANVSFDSNAQIVFDGTDDVITVSMTNLRPATQITQEVVVYIDTNTTQVWIGSQYGTSSNNSYALWLNSANSLYGGVNIAGSFNNQGVTYPITTNMWYHFVHTYDGTAQRLYANGVEVHSWSTSGTIAYDTNNTLLAIGNDWNGTGYNSGASLATHGKQDITRIYNRALSSSEVKQNYNKYKTRFNLP